MPPLTRKALARDGGRGGGRRRCEQDSDEEDFGPREPSTEPPIQELTAEQKQMNAIRSMEDDLGSGRRDYVTKVDNRREQRIDFEAIYGEERGCNQEGTEAAELAAQNKKQLSGWANFGATDTAKDGNYEILPDIGNGQTHRGAVASQLRQEGISSLEDTYGGDHRRRGGIPPPMATHAGGLSRSVRGGRGGGFTSVGGRPAPMSSRPSGRLLDPAIVSGEKDSKYANGALQTKAKAKPKAKANVRMDNMTVKVTPVTPKGGRAVVSRRAVQHMIQLADQATFMAAATSLQRPAGQPESKKTELPKPQVAEVVADKNSNVLPAAPVATIKGVPIPVSEKATIKKISREELRAPTTSPDSLTQGKPSPEVLQSPSVGESEHGPVVGLGIAGVKIQRSVVGSTPAPEMVEVEVQVICRLLDADDMKGLKEYLISLVMPASKPTQTLRGLASSKWAISVEEPAETKKPYENPFGARETLGETSILHQPLLVQPVAMQVVQPVPPPAKPTRKPKGLSESRWATGDTSAPLQPKSTNGSLQSFVKTDAAIFGDARNVSRLSKDDVKRVKVAQSAGVAKPTAIKRITQPCPGYENLKREKEEQDSKPTQAAPKAAPEVDAALNLTNNLCLQFGGGYGRKKDGDDNESDESEL